MSPSTLSPGALSSSREPQNLNWLINSFVDRVPKVKYALVVTSDGLPLVMSAKLPRDLADHLSAITSGLINLADGASSFLEGDGVRQAVIEMGKAFLFLMSVSDGSSLAVVTSDACEVGLVGYEMARLVKQAGEMLTPALRSELQATLPH